MATTNARKPDLILKAVEKPEQGESFGRAFRVGAAWVNEETETISLVIDSYVVLKGKPYTNTHLLLVKNEDNGE